MANIYDMADTWNDGLTTFTAIKMNVTDTSSSASSLLMDLQVGGVSRFNVTKAGDVNINQTGSAGPYTLRIGNAGTLYTYGSNFGAQPLYVNYSGGLAIPNNTGLIRFGISTDLVLARDAANTLALRNITNAQTFNIYNTYTDASNYERGFLKWNSNVLEIGTEAGGTGTARSISFLAGGSSRLSIATTGVVSVSGSEIITASSITYFGSSTSGFTFRYNNGANSDLLARFGGVTSSYPAIKRSTTSLQARLADDSAFTNIQGKLTTETAYTAGVTTATGYIVLYDSTGTAYKVPAEAL